MDSSQNGERRDGQRFTIPCPVTLVLRGKGRKVSQEQGRLFDIGVRGASFYAPTPLDIGSNITLLIEFPDGTGRVRAVEFEGLVTRAQTKPLYEAAVVFRRRGRFVRSNLEELLLRFSPEEEPEAVDPKTPERQREIG